MWDALFFPPREPASLGLMVRSAAKQRVSNHGAAPSFETPAFAALRRAPQDEADRRRRTLKENMTTILITGFGPFPGAPYNPTEMLVRALGKLRRPALHDVTIVTHVFPVSYAAVDRDLPALLAKHKPDAVLMFGLAARTKHIRIETRARNALALMPDAASASLRRSQIARAAPAARSLPAPMRQLLAAARQARLPAALSPDAGRYLCNYVSWRAAEAAGKPAGPRLAAFVHVPLTARGPRPRRTGRRLTAQDLARAGTRILLALTAAARR